MILISRIPATGVIPFKHIICVAIARKLEIRDENMSDQKRTMSSHFLTRSKGMCSCSQDIFGALLKTSMLLTPSDLSIKDDRFMLVNLALRIRWNSFPTMKSRTGHKCSQKLN